MAVFGDDIEEKSKSMSSDSDDLDKEYKADDIPVTPGNNQDSESEEDAKSDDAVANVEENAQEDPENEEITEEDIAEEQSIQRYYNKRQCGSYEKTILVSSESFWVAVNNPENVKGKGLKSGYTVYTITLDPFKWSVKRRYSDFEWLVKCLEKRFPSNYIPALPPKSLAKKNLDNVQLRIYAFQKFLEVVLSSSELTYSPELVQFLSLGDEEFSKAKKVNFNPFPLSNTVLGW